ncbi:MAG: hypothetical protein K6C36_09245, partial [Clostridia bacterium]|nr:hypothetical protein [Clostridia bacterium]
AQPTKGDRYCCPAALPPGFVILECYPLSAIGYLLTPFFSLANSRGVMYNRRIRQVFYGGAS